MEATTSGRDLYWCFKTWDGVHVTPLLTLPRDRWISRCKGVQIGNGSASGASISRGPIELAYSFRLFSTNLLRECSRFV